MDNHRDRPGDSRGPRRRRGALDPLQCHRTGRTIYVAVPLMHGGKPTAAVRTSLPVTALTRTLAHRSRPDRCCRPWSGASPRGDQPGDFPPHEPAAGGDQGRGRAFAAGDLGHRLRDRRFRGNRRGGRGDEPHGRAVGRANPDGAAPAERARSDVIEHGGRSLGHRQRRHDPQPERDLRDSAGRGTGQAARPHACTK